MIVGARILIWESIVTSWESPTKMEIWEGKWFLTKLYIPEHTSSNVSSTKNYWTDLFWLLLLPVIACSPGLTARIDQTWGSHRFPPKTKTQRNEESINANHVVCQLKVEGSPGWLCWWISRDTEQTPGFILMVCWLLIWFSYVMSDYFRLFRIFIPILLKQTWFI